MLQSPPLRFNIGSSNKSLVTGSLSVSDRHFFPLRLHYPTPTDIDRSLNESTVNKIRTYRDDYNIRPSNTISFMSDVVNTSDQPPL